MSSSSLHVAIIMDGNGRWGKEQGKSRLWGHHQGAKTLKKIIKACPLYQIRYLTIYAFSSENWTRPRKEVEGLMKLFEKYLKKETAKLHQEGICLRMIGNRLGLSSSLLELIHYGEELTHLNTGLGLQIAFNYGGRDEIMNAVRRIVTMVKDHHLDSEQITYEDFIQGLWTYPWPDPDLLIRTGGEMRLSNYLLWQLSYTEFIFSTKYWPEFTPQDLCEAIHTYHQRQRRFGGTLKKSSIPCKKE